MIGKMAKVEILGVKDVFLDTVDAIHEEGTLHIEDLSEKIQLMDTKRVSRMEMDPRFVEHESSLVNLRQKVADMIQELKLPIESIPRDEVARIYGTIWSDNVEVTVSKVESIIGDVEGATKGLVDQKQNLEVELSRLEKYAPIMQKVQPLADRVARMENMASIALIIERKYKAILNYLNDEISKITGGECEVVSADVDEESTAALVVFNRRYLKQVHDFLAVQNVNQVRLPSDLARKPLDDAVKEVRERIDSIPAELDNVNRQLATVSKKYYASLLAARNAVHDRLETMEAVPKFGQTDEVFIVSGWLPVDSIEPMEEKLASKFGTDVMMNVIEVHEEEEEETPVMLKNGPFTRYFEIIYMLSKYPKYGTTDPTLIFAIFFPILFGFMVGDVGYGIIIMVAGYLVHRKFRDKPLVNMLGFAMTVGGAWAIAFGAIFFEMFGNLPERFFNLVHETGGVETFTYFAGSDKTVWRYPVNRMDMFLFMLFAALAIGYIHLTVGFVVGIVNGIKEKNYKHSMEKAGGLAVLTGLALAVASMKYIPKPFLWIGILMIVGGAVAATFGAGMGGLIEAVLGAGNILSYSRLLAIGLASVILAKVANDLGSSMFKAGVAGIIGGIIVAVLLHTLNLVIAVFSPSIHALRLHLVENFGKFFEPAKYKYEPFKKTGGES